ncbi:hypothetical protein [Morganella morganii]|uniref:hypothetical protein n=1 Tax=Morganella morganii TaxID=582 RepID=UPI001BDA17D6|nr:hypothetical protein [Morganella morganii]MBT0422802.1 hypothetical protein [Morganella morganii subsp. morganii]MBT0517390.1 hypothetical protein [Morganella morganii subsp. morganii]QWM05683.1 hypothetical protein IZ185_08275 [Morganella morganii subsp. morganii]
MADSEDKSSPVSEVLKCMVIPGYSFYKLYDVLSGTEDNTTDELKESAKRSELESFILQSRAKVEQELSIARRIMCADEVEIEEYYDINGKGSVGVKTDESSFTIGASGEGRKVTKRVIKFKGFGEKYIQEIKNELNEMEENSTAITRDK